MTAIHYLDFDLAIEPVARKRTWYRARVLNSPVGQASTAFKLPFSKMEVENYILKIGRTRQGMRSLNSVEERAAQEFGSRLYNAIFQDQVRDCLRRSLDVATQRPGQGLRIRLRLTAAQELTNLPWEYLYDVPFKRFFVHSHTTPIVRYLDLPQGTQPLTVQLPLNVLVMIANPRDYLPLDVEAEWRKVQDALADLVQRELVTVTRLEKATLLGLQRQLRRKEYHIFHFIGHGDFDRQMQEGVLLLEDDKGLLRMVAGSYLATLLHDHPTLQLAVLNACEGARMAQIDHFASVAQTLIQQGVPAVIAMQFAITDQAAITLAHEFYTALADGYPVDAALAEARKAIYAEGNDVEWGTPVLYMRSPDGQIFDVAANSKGHYEFAGRPSVDHQVTNKLEPVSRKPLSGVGPAPVQAKNTSSPVEKVEPTQSQVEKIRILLADDHPIVRTGLRLLLQGAPDIDVVAEAKSGYEALTLVEQFQPDVLLLDMEMPGLSGVEVAKKLKLMNSPVRVLAFSAHDNEQYVRSLLNSGAAGYLTKEDGDVMIIDAVRGVAHGEEGWFSRGVVARLSTWARDMLAREIMLADVPQITERERDVLRLVVEGKTNQEIGIHLNISEKTVEKHVDSILTKLGVSSRVEAAIQGFVK